MPQETQSWDALSMLGGIIALIIVLVLSYFTIKMLARRYTIQTPKHGSIQILERVALGPDRFLVVVQCADKVLLLGVTPQHIELLQELDPQLVQTLSENQETAAGFSDILRNALEKGWGLAGKHEKSKDDKHS